jgi:predicted nucleic acid-binding protein
MICVDANVVIRLVLGGEHAELIAERWTSLRESGRTVAAPSLLRYEVCNVVRRYAVMGVITDEEAAAALDTVLDLRIALNADPSMHRRALSIATSLGLPSTYDAHYLALADMLNAPLLTLDRRLARRVEGTEFEIELLGG